MIQRLVILGFLKKHSASGYDIKKFMKEELGIFSELKNSSVYYPLSRMEKEGLIKKRQNGERGIRKYLYSITPKGEKKFLKLCKDALVSQRRPFIELDIALYFLPFLASRDIIPLLRLRSMFIDSVKKWLISKEEELKNSPPNLRLLIKHHQKLADAEKGFVKDIMAFVKSRDAESDTIKGSTKPH